MADYGQDILNDGLGRLEGDWKYKGQTFDLVVENIGYTDWKRVQQYAALSQQVNAVGDDPNEREVEAVTNQAENLEAFTWEDEDNQTDFVETIMSVKLVRPEVELETTSSDKIGAIVEGMMEAWQEAHDVQQAREEMPIEGNR